MLAAIVAVGKSGAAALFSAPRSQAADPAGRQRDERLAGAHARPVCATTTPEDEREAD